jgi:hypothetical protein
MTLAETMERAKAALRAEYEWLIAQGFTEDEAIALMRQREIEANGW